MLSLLEFILTEEKKVTDAKNNAAGVAFEVQTAKHIKHILSGKPNSHPDDHLPDHFSDESGDSPEDSLKKQKKILGNKNYAIADYHARRMAHHIVNHLKKRGIKLDDTAKVSWTSKPNDLERLTGIKGIKGTADITISHKGKHYGFSLKYSQAGDTKPSLRSPGIDSLNTMLGADEDHVSNLTREMHKSADRFMGHLVGTGSMKEKHQRAKKYLKTKEFAKAAEAARDVHKKLATHYADSFNKNLNHERRAAFIRKMNDAEEKPTIEPYRAGYDAKRGSYISNPTKDFNEIHANTQSYSAESSGASVNIFAHHHDGSRSKVCSFGIKNKHSTPFGNLGGRVSDVSKNIDYRR